MANKVSIAPTFYEELFCTKLFCKAFMSLQFEFAQFLQKEIGAKAACKKWVKLTKGVNFTIFTIFLCKSVLCSFYLFSV
jgi:hypothetical protein